MGAFPGDDSATYRVEVYEVIPDGDGGMVPAALPIISFGGIPANGYAFMPDDPQLVPLREYAYAVIAESGGTLYAGRPVPFFGHGDRNSAEIEELPIGGAEKNAKKGAADAAEKSGDGPTNWKKLMATYTELNKQKEAIAEAIRQNPLVQEAEVLRLLKTLLRDHEALKDYIKAILEGKIDEIRDQIATPETAIKVLCYLETTLDYFAKYSKSPRMTDARRQALRNLAADIKVIKEALKEGNDTVQGALDKLKEKIAEAKALADDPLQFILDAIKDRLFEKLRDILIRQLGAKAGSAAFSILLDLINLGDLALDNLSIEEICRQMNLLLLEGIDCDAKGTVSPTGRKYQANVGRNYLNCDVTLAYKKLCFSPKPDGQPGEGEWVESPIRFADGSPTKTVRAAAHVTGPGRRPGQEFVEIENELMTADIQCPPGSNQKCLVVLDVQWACPPPLSNISIRLFVGVIRCP
ncbi:MAG: hypothetical protein R3F11_08520 [Verrucomicrobiales bacterium]